MRILIAEDEKEIAKALKVVLEKNRYVVDTVDNGADALDYILMGHYDVIVLDIMMPERDGISVLKAIREKKIDTPVLLLTAKSEVEDRVVGLNAGADDYLPKPFAISEFVARVKALGRRAAAFTPDVITVGDTHLDSGSYDLYTDKGKQRLNNKEFQVIELFMRNPRQIFPTIKIMELVWGYETDSEINVVWTYIANLRKKLREIEAGVEIKTVRGAGFSLEEKDAP